MEETNTWVIEGCETFIGGNEDCDLFPNNYIKKITEAKNKTIFNKTENGAEAYDTTNSFALDLFIKLVRNAKEELIIPLFHSAWKESPEIAVKIIFQTRDIRTGKGEKDVSFILLKELKEHYPETYKLNLKNLINYGRFDDLLIMSDYETENMDVNFELSILAEQLKEDENKDHPSLASKWAPREHTKSKSFYKLINLLFPNSSTKEKDYRLMIKKNMDKLNVVETLMCKNKWDEINFSHVPSKAMKLYGRKNVRKYNKNKTIDEKCEGAFARHQGERFTEFLTNVATGKEKINVKGIHPHELVDHYYKGNDVDEIIEMQWNKIIDELKREGNINAISVVDVSGSMTSNDGLPLKVAISLGLITAELAIGEFHNKVITFDTNPTLCEITKTSLYDKFNEIKYIGWGMSTDLEKVFDLILENTTNENIPKMIFIFTDMQFNCASKMPEKTLYENIKRKYSENNRLLPKLIFWNLGSSETPGFPVTMSDFGTIYVSGFSQILLTSFMKGLSFYPIEIMMELLKKYDVIIHPNEI